MALFLGPFRGGIKPFVFTASLCHLSSNNLKNIKPDNIATLSAVMTPVMFHNLSGIKSIVSIKVYRVECSRDDGRAGRRKDNGTNLTSHAPKAVSSVQYFVPAVIDLMASVLRVHRNPYTHHVLGSMI